MIRTADRAYEAPSALALPSIAALLGRVALMARVASERRALSRLDADRLNDIGLSAGRADAEAARPFWEAPRARLDRCA